MVLNTLSAQSLDAAVRTVACELQYRRRSPRSWWHLSEQELWHELAACILGSAVSYEQATSAFRLLKSSDLLRLPAHPTELSLFEQHIADALSGRVKVNLQAAKRYRFPLRRARQLRQTIESVYFQGASLRVLLQAGKDRRAVRAELIRLGSGVGPKQASLFLRNVGYGDFAVLDRHVARFMLVRGLMGVEPQLNTLPQYEKAEEAFFAYAATIGVPVVELDLAVWLVVRVAKRGVQA
jgi:N-glycosylase/DNA lyase